MRLVVVARVRQVVLQAGQEKIPEAAFGRGNPGDEVTRQQAGEELLGQILRVFTGLAASACIGIERIPIGAA